LRTDPGYLREQVFARDHGICAGCGADTVALEGELKRLRRRNPIAWKQRLEELCIPAARKKNLWDADHIVPVAEGGGECGLDNLRTLCLRCHRLVTEELRKRLQRRKLEL
jgi:5-methylcytosine-specific restriction endonuclease McrA